MAVAGAAILAPRRDGFAAEDCSTAVRAEAIGSALLDRYGTAIRYMEEDGFQIAARVYMVLEGENLASMAKTTGLGLLELATVFDNLKPDVVVTYAEDGIYGHPDHKAIHRHATSVNSATSSYLRSK